MIKIISRGFVLGLVLSCSFITSAQEKVFQTFKDTRVINTHSTEITPAGKLDFRVAHRFGDIAGDAGGWTSFYGLESASDVLFGFEYGLSDNGMIGISRTKGAGPLRQNVHGMFKWRLIHQEIHGKQPLSLALLGITSYSTMGKSPSEGVLSFFVKKSHRVSYHLSLIMAKKFSNRFSLQLNGSWTYRNLVPNVDKNDLVSAGAAWRFQMTRSFGLIFDTTFPISELRTSENGYYPSIGVGLEWDTGGGHIFQMNFTNSTGIAETDYIPYTTSNWADGEFRLGFTISRLFTI